MEKRIHHILELYGYQDIETPTFEFFDIFNSDTGTVSSVEMFKFFDRNNNTLVLRPDMTPLLQEVWQSIIVPVNFHFVFLTAGIHF